MTKIDFYILQPGSGQRSDRFLCKLAAKAWRSQHRIYIHAASQAQTKAIDDLLWTFKDISFLPHQQVSGECDPETPILIGHGEPPDGFDDIMINMADTVPAFFHRFKRILEIVDPDADKKKAARQRYRQYQDHGNAPHAHEIRSDND